VVLELRARFDEEANMYWKSYLEDEGVKVLLGIPGMKVHAKICVIKKREFNKTMQFGFISTGNFNENTASYYGDHVLMTANRAILADINRIFDYIEHPHKRATVLKQCKVLPVSPVSMRAAMMAAMEKQIKLAKKKEAGFATIKLNSLVDPVLVDQIYAAARAGVHVQMVIRGICCAYTEIGKIKGSIQAISIIDDYLEHARVLIFGTGKDADVYISSADWMVRNLDHRIEAACPIYDKTIRQELTDILSIQLAENVKGRILDNEQSNNYVERSNDEVAIRSQEAIYKYLQNKTY
jgi:polyphosphate kinase